MKTELTPATILAERLRRQRLASPLQKRGEYLELFRLLQPVPTIYSARPGDPPRLVHRTLFDDRREADRKRADRTIVKGRFLKGSIGYVLAEDLSIYANAFCRPLPLLNETQSVVLEAVQSLGPLTPRQVKEETGLPNKVLMPALHRLQEAFLVYEDQPDSDWERGWYGFADEWPQVEIDEGKWTDAATEVVLRFLQGHVFATPEQIKDWSGFPSRRLAALLCDMEERHLIVSRTIGRLGQGWLRASDLDLEPKEVEPSIFMLHKADPLVKSCSSELKQRFGKHETLEYLLIDGEFRGAVLGHWRIGPYDVDDILVELPAEEQARRRQEVLDAVAQVYQPPFSHILKYAGCRIVG